MADRPKIVLLGGDGGRSGVPRHIAHLCEVLAPEANITVISDIDRGGYGFAKNLKHLQISGLETSLSPRSALSAARALGAALDRERADLVWAHARMSLPLSRWVMRGGGMGRLMTTYHGLPFGPGHGALRSAVSLALEGLGLWAGPPQDLVFLTREDHTAMPARLIGRHRSHILPNCSLLGGADDTPKLQVGPRRLVMLTRDSRQKHLDLAARLFGALPADFTLDLHGMGTDSADLKARFLAVMGAQAMARVRFCGPATDVRPILSQADALLVTSRYEGLSIAMIEAMEMGVPVISTRVGGTELIGRVHPLFAELSDNAAQSAQQIDRVTATYRAAPQSWTKQIHAAWAQTFAPDLWAQKVRDLVALVLKDRP